MKKIIGGLILFIGITLIPTLTQAANVTVNELQSEQVLFMDFDVLALEFDLEGAPNELLQTVTVEHSGNSRPEIDFTNLTLWADTSEVGFQGWGFDTQLGVAELFNGVYVFDDLNHIIANNNARFYVSIESGTFIDNKNSQFLLSQQKDSNNNGIWEEGETGIFIQGETISNLEENYTSKVISFKDTKADVQPPKGYIANLQSPPTENIFYSLIGDKLTFNGFARDRGGNTVSSVVVIVNDQEIPAQSTLGQYEEWTADYLPIGDDEVLSVALEITDSLGQTWTSLIYQVEIDVREADASRTFFSRSKIIIEPNGSDSSTLTLTVLDASGNPLSNRTVQFIANRSADTLTTDSVITDEDGKVSVMLTSTEEGNAIVQAMIGGEQIALTSVTVLAEGESDTPSEPVTLPEGLSTGDLIKASLDAVYYLDSNGVRHVFVTDRIYFSWYGNDFSAVKTISDSLLASIPLGDPVSYRPGTLLTAPSINEVYVVDVNRTLRHIGSESVAKALYGETWNKQIIDLQESLLFAYNFGAIINSASDVNIAEIESLPITINSELVS